MRKAMIIIISLCVILTAVVTANASGETKLNFTVVFKSERLPDNVHDLISGLGGKILTTIPEIGVVQVEAAPAFARTALKSREIQSATPSLVEVLPKDHRKIDTSSLNIGDAALYNMYQWDIKRVTQNGSAFGLGTGSHDVVVGVIDTGVDLNHPDLQANLVGGSKNFVPAGGFYGNDLSETGNIADVQDRFGHGSHVTGNIAGKGSILGVAPDVGYRSYRVMGGTGGSYSTWIAQAMVAAANDGTDIISISFTGINIKGQVWYTDPGTGEKIRLGNDIADYLVYMRAANYADRKGSLIVAAAGNDALNSSNKKDVTDYANGIYGQYGYTFVGASLPAPASLPNVVTVSATGPDDQLALYSNYGPGFIDVAAPGGDYRLYLNTPEDERTAENVFAKEFCLSSVPFIEPVYSPDQTVITGYNYRSPGYAFNIGTSMATPKASAVAALIISRHGKLPPSRIKEMLQKTAEDIGKTGYDSSFGHGMVSSSNALGQK
ncbi:MAG: hypothetical protein VR68_01570 [Peptococcaceae bacterium BRH_c4a]|nr:MAG: hypothetical protein VR68_01570 [Peptococcaceae bacterium BRH_c4a]